MNLTRKMVEALEIVASLQGVGGSATRSTGNDLRLGTISAASSSALEARGLVSVDYERGRGRDVTLTAEGRAELARRAEVSADA